MIWIALLILIACTGTVYGLYLIREQQRTRLSVLIESLERESGLAESMDFAPSGGIDNGVSANRDVERLMLAGQPNGLDARQFANTKLIGLLLLPALVPLVTLFNWGVETVVITLLAACAGFLLPEVWLNARIADRRRAVAEELPLFTDLIATAVSAGLSLPEAIRRVAQDSPGLISREFLRSVQQMAAGKPRLQAWRDLMKRLPGPDLRSIVSAIMQAEQFGTSVAEILRYQVQQIRLFKQQDAHRIAQSTNVRMRVPMLLLILFPFMVLLLGPATVQVAELLVRR